MLSSCLNVAGSIGATRRKRVDEYEESGEETTPTTASDFEDLSHDDDSEYLATKDDLATPTGDDAEASRQLGPGLFPPEDEEAEAAAGAEVEAPAPVATPAPAAAPAGGEAVAEGAAGAGFTRHETLIVFDWDDTILPSTWIQRQRLRLDAGSVVRPWQQRELAEVAATAAEMLHAAKRRGTVVLLTNAERGWIELSCQKFLPMLLPVIENIKIVSARTTYETALCKSPLDWKVHAFEDEIARACGSAALLDPAQRKNIHSLGDSIYEREALLRATTSLPNCCSKSVKFVERPDLQQILKQHALVTASFDQIVQHNGPLDMGITC